MVSASGPWDLKVESSNPGRCTHVVFLGKTLLSLSSSLQPGGVEIHPSRFILQKPEINAGRVSYVSSGSFASHRVGLSGSTVRRDL